MLLKRLTMTLAPVMTGLLLGLKEARWHDTTVFAAETEGTASFAAAWAAGELVTLSKVSGLATTLGALCVAQGVLDLAKEHGKVCMLLVHD